MQSPPFRPLTDREIEDAVDEINCLKPTFVWVGLGAPKQERWMARVMARLDTSILIGVGAAFRFLIADYRHPPSMVQLCALEGLYWRLPKHPIRVLLWYAYHVPAFGSLVTRMLLRRAFGEKT